ncbi:hypothetical protein Ocin01_12449 [Orchesella cincta]|uniref:Conotoxin n=1 Tax=Orchesella cincta TaxID=48709 RepID=A0A1D2MME8_ORCCI|nr:hypothetical protein Ocin01_12449 [Orchesella cincta]
MGNSSKIILFGLLIAAVLLVDSTSAQRGPSVPASRNRSNRNNALCTTCTGACSGYVCCDGTHRICGVSGNQCMCFRNP